MVGVLGFVPPSDTSLMFGMLFSSFRYVRGVHVALHPHHCLCEEAHNVLGLTCRDEPGITSHSWYASWSTDASHAPQNFREPHSLKSVRGYTKAVRFYTATTA